MENDNIKIRKAELFVSQGYLFLLEREKTTILIVQLLLALLVLATFSEKIISESYSKSIILIILFAVPILIWDYILKINDAINSIEGALSMKKKKERWYLIPFKLSPYYFVLFLTIIVDCVCFFIINEPLKALFWCLVQVIIIALIIFSKRAA